MNPVTLHNKTGRHLVSAAMTIKLWSWSATG